MVPKNNVPNVAKVATLQNAKTETKVETAKVENVPVVSLAFIVSQVIAEVKKRAGTVSQKVGTVLESKKYEILFSVLSQYDAYVERFGSDKEVATRTPLKGSHLINHHKLYRAVLYGDGFKEMLKIELGNGVYVHYRNTLFTIFQDSEKFSEKSFSQKTYELDALKDAQRAKDTEERKQSETK